MEPSSPPSAGILLPILALLLLLSMFFSAAETAFLSSSKLHLRYLVEKKNRKAIRVARLLANKTKFLNTILIGNNVVNIALTSLATSLAVAAFGDAGIGVATAAATIGILVFGEILPKTVALVRSERIALKISLPIAVLVAALTPLVWAISTLTDAIASLVGGKKASDGARVTEEDLIALIEVGEEEGILAAPERELMRNILNYADLNARDIMTPRTDIITVPLGASRAEVERISGETGFSRLPVCGDGIDDVRGILYVKDFLFADGPGKKNKSVKDVIRPALFIFEGQKISDVQKKLRDENQNLAMVIDEYGGIAGLVSTQDLVEEIFGRLDDENDGSGTLEGDGPDGETADGDARLDAINERLGTTLASQFYDTLGGFIMERLDGIPLEGSRVYEQGFAFEVLTMSRNRVGAVKILRQGRRDER